MDSKIKLNIFIAVVVLVMILGGYIAYITLYKYELLVKIILAGWLLLLLYKDFFKNDNKSGGLSSIDIKFPRDLKLVPYFLILSIVIGWGFKQFFDSLVTLIYQVAR